MKEFFKDIFSYHSFCNQKLIEQLRETEPVLPERTIPLFSHTLNAQQIWNARITGGEPIKPFTVYDLKDCPQIDLEYHGVTLQILEDCDLDAAVQYSNTKGETFSNTIREILFHINNHYTHHRGQIISDIRQSGVAPIITDYIFYKRAH